ncbi:MAG: FAD-dependent oxidoreductase [Candidatus Kapaibacterium sp.]|nr:MAG: FAD-dependent oxidoreductase [Candidatus Kapabacteria bacterium]
MAEIEVSQRKTIAIIGGGVSGLYAAWKMLYEKNLTDVDIHIYEAAQKCTGRISTAWIHNGFPIELGAARFSKYVHPVLNRLVEHFQLKTMPYEYANRFWHLRGKKLGLDDIAAGKAAYELRENEIGKYTDNLYDYTETNSKRTEAEINAMSFHEYLAEHISEEACTFFRDAEGYDLLLGEWLSGMDGVRAVKQHPDMLPKSEVSWFHIVGGFQMLMKTLEEQVTARGAKIFTNHRCIELIQNENSVTVYVEAQQNNDSIVKYIEADRVFLCVKRLDIADITLPLSQEKLDAMEAVEPVPMVKMFATYTNSWWSSFSRRDGNFCITDMPIRKIYYGPGHHLMFYSDCQSALYWKDFIAESGRKPEALLGEVQRQLALIYRMDPAKLPRPTAFYSKFWSTGIHVWRRNSDPTKVRNLLMGTAAERIHIAGESFAVNAGWVEGALETINLLIDGVLYP